MATMIKTTDFAVGLRRVAQDQNSTVQFASFITSQRERELVNQILGRSLGTLFLADLIGDPQIPQSSRFSLIFNRFEFDYAGLSVSCDGLKEILKGFLYDDYVQQQHITNTITGNVVTLKEASEPVPLNDKLTDSYNKNIRQLNNLQLFVNNSTDYPEYSCDKVFYSRSPL